MNERIKFAIPFEGFYQTDLDEELDNHILRLNGVSPDDYLNAEAYLETVDYPATHAQVAEQYAIKWFEHRNLQTGRFEEYIPPRTVQPRHFLKVSVDLEELSLAYADILAESGKPTTQVEWDDIKPEIAWEDAWAYLEQEVDAEQTVPDLIRETLRDDGHMDPIFKE